MEDTYLIKIKNPPIVPSYKIFIKLNKDELIGLDKILTFFKLKFTISKINYHGSGRIIGSLRGIYPITIEKDLNFYQTRLDNFKDKYFFETKQYLILLDNIDQVDGCILGLQILDKQDEIVSLSRNNTSVRIPIIYLDDKVIRF